MGFQLKLLGFVVFLLLTLSFCQANNVTVKVIGSIHCTDCIRHEFSNSQTSPGVDVFISCKSKNRETKTQGNSAIDEQGKFNVTLSSEVTEDVQSCFAKLQTASSGDADAGAPCPLQSAQTASVELLSTQENATQTAYNKPTIIKFSPATCQSAIFCWPLPNLTFFPSSPPPAEYAPPPSEALPPVQPPLPPPEDVIPPPAPASEPPFSPQVPSPPPELPPPAPEFEIQPPAPAPAFHSPQNQPKPTIKNPTPPPLPINKPPPPLYSPIPPPTPQSQHPIPHIPLKKHKKPHPIKTPIAPAPLPETPKSPPPIPGTPKSPPPIPETPNSPPPIPETPNSPPPIPKHENPAPPPSPIKSTPPSEKKPGFIPRAPPVPRLPPVPQAPRKYFNAPKSKSKPPHSY